MLAFLLLPLWLCHSLNFTDLPSEVVSHKILGSLSITDKIQSIASLNKASHLLFSLYHQDEIALYKKLLYEISMLNADSLSIIQNITERLQLSEIWPFMLPNALKMISFHRWYEKELILEAMNMHTMTMSEFSRLHIIRNCSSAETDILILASRALIHYYVIGDNIDAQNMRYFSNLKIDDYPWLYYVLSDGQTFHKHWAIYMSYLYETIFDLGYKTANIPKLDCVFKHEKICDDEDHEKRNNLGELIKYGLIVWSRDNIHELRSEFFQKHYAKYCFFLIVLEAHAMNTELRQVILFPFEYETEFMTRFVLDIVNKYAVNMSMNIHNKVQFDAFAKTMSVIERYRYDNFERGDYESFDKLSNLMIEIGQNTDEEFLIMEYLAECPVNAAYINTTIRILKQQQPKLKHKNLRELLWKIIVWRAEGNYLASSMPLAREEIEKLAHDALFREDAFKVLMDTSDRAFAAQMIRILWGLRTDWLLGSRLIRKICLPSLLNNVLTS